LSKPVNTATRLKNILIDDDEGNNDNNEFNLLPKKQEESVDSSKLVVNTKKESEDFSIKTKPLVPMSTKNDSSSNFKFDPLSVKEKSNNMEEEIKGPGDAKKIRLSSDFSSAQNALAGKLNFNPGMMRNSNPFNMEKQVSSSSAYNSNLTNPDDSYYEDMIEGRSSKVVKTNKKKPKMKAFGESDSREPSISNTVPSNPSPEHKPIQTTGAKLSNLFNIPEDDDNEMKFEVKTKADNKPAESSKKKFFFDDD